MFMLHSGNQHFVLREGTYTLGGLGPKAIPLASLERSPEVAEIVVPESGAATIQRLTASVLVRLDHTPIGIAPKPLVDGVVIEFNGCRLTFQNDAPAATVPSPPTADDLSTPVDMPVEAHANPRAAADRPIADPSPSLTFPHQPTTPTCKARLVNVRTGNGIDLGDWRILVGRDEACEMVLPGMGVSRRHCSITPVQGGYLLRDESANGTFVNGARVPGTYLLGHGDTIGIADEELRVEVEGSAAPASNTTAAPTVILDLSRLRSEDGDRGSRDRPATPLVASLEIVRGPYSGASFSIDRPVCTIGRATDSDVRIRDESVSANHATLLRKGTSWFVVDLRSANGTFVDGLRIAGERELTSGSRLKLGRVELEFRALETSDEATSSARRGRSWLRELLTPWFSPRESGSSAREHSVDEAHADQHARAS